MEEIRHGYEILKEILSRSDVQPCNRDAIRCEIEGAIGGRDYVAVVIDYLWGAYYHCDPCAKAAFERIFAEELRERKPDVFQFFAYYFGHTFPRRGFDRRMQDDRRGGYSLEFTEQVGERRTGRERRRGKEKRVDWTRISEWASVPFRSPEGGRDAADAAAAPPAAAADGPVPPNLRSLNTILSCLVAYYENYMQPRQTAWQEELDRELFARARRVMRAMIEMPEGEEPPAGGHLRGKEG